MSPCTVLVARELAVTLPASCLGGCLIGDQIDEARIDALERRRLRVGDVARDVFERERLRPHASDRRSESPEDTHDLISNCGGQLLPGHCASCFANRAPN